MITFGTIVGPSKLIVPSITGLVTSDAENALNAVGLAHSSSATNNTDAAQNTKAYSQSVAGGTLLLRANAQTLTYQYYTFAFFSFFSFAPFGFFSFTPFGFTPFGFTPYGFFGFFSFFSYDYGT